MAPTENTTRLAQVEAERDRAIAERDKAMAEREHYRRIYLEMLERNKRLEQGLLGQKSERLSESESQLTLQILGSLLASGETEAVAAAQSDPPYEPTREDSSAKKVHPTRAKPKGRRVLPEHLPRIDIELIPEEVQREGLDAFERLPGEISETIERRQSSMVVLRTHRPRFIRKDRERNGTTKFLVAEPLDLPIDRGLAGPGLLADTVVKRFQDHSPLNRLEQIYTREGLHIARSTICGWHEELADLLGSLIDAMWQDARSSPYLCTDATGVLVQAKERCRHGHFWVVVAPERHVLYGYSPRHDGEAVDRILAGYRGYLVADAHAVYDHLYTDGEILEVGCWAHTRRYFFKALSSEPVLAREALALISELFRLEHESTGMTAKKRKQHRHEHSKPVVERFFAWCDQHVLAVLDDTPIAKGIGYARNQRIALQRFLQDGRLPMHNNISELHLRRQAIGRKNWLFIGNDEAGQVNTTFVSLLASCQMHGIEPWAYMRDLLCLLPYWRQTRLLELAPVHWNETLQKQEAQEILAENVSRRIAIGELDRHLSEA